VTITKHNTDLTRLQSLLREFAHESLDLSRGGLEPRRRRSSVGKSRFALSFSVICVCCCELQVFCDERRRYRAAKIISRRRYV
jgi:hypothetical protein